MGNHPAEATHCVIGSGPAGVAAAAALLGQGQRVLMLDAGGDLESAIRANVDRLAARRPDQWTVAEMDRLKGPLRYNSEGAPLKLAFGSDYPYRDVDELQPIRADGVDVYRAMAAGGLSVLWGAAILPFSDADLDGWPVSAADLAPHYTAVLDLTGLAAADDGLSRRYPLYVTPSSLAPSRQAQLVLQHSGGHAAALEEQGVLVGRARLAVAQPNRSGQSCAYCGMCLYGCPYGLIYSASHTLEQLLGSPAFTYAGGLLVQRLEERGGRVVIDTVARQGKEPRRFECGRAYLAAGAFDSTAILLRSLGATSRPVLLRQSDHFLLPVLLARGVPQVGAERLHTLSQAFIELLEGAVSSYGVHLQLYTYSDFYPRMARDRLGPFFPVMAPLLELLMARMSVLKGYLHSEDSTAIRAVLEPVDADRSVLRVSAVPSARSRAVLRKVVSLLRRNRRRLGLRPVGLALRLGRPGSGVHVGGSFPMRARPGDFEADTLGRPTGFDRVHVVDSTVFPTLPAASPTLTIMANAFRIAVETAGRP